MPKQNIEPEENIYANLQHNGPVIANQPGQGGNTPLILPKVQRNYIQENKKLPKIRKTFN